jgi:hypothetical protein
MLKEHADQGKTEVWLRGLGIEARKAASDPLQK